MTIIRQAKIVLALILSFIFFPINSFAQVDVGKWKRFEVSFSNSTWSGNPFDLILDGVFTHIDTGETITVPGFYAGSDTWKLFFMPDKLGEWTFVTQSDDADLHNKSGSFTSISSGLPGRLVPVGNRWKLEDGGFIAPIMLRTLMWFREENGFTDFDVFLPWAKDTVGVTIVGHRFGMGSSHRSSDGSGTGEVWTIEGEEFNIPMFDRLNQQYDAIRDAGMGHYIMFYDDDQDTPTWDGESAEELRLFRYFVARFSAYPIVMWDTGIDIGEYRSDTWIDWFADWFNQNDPDKHPVSSRTGGGSGGKLPVNATYYSDGESTLPSHSSVVSTWTSRSIPTAFTDIWTEYASRFGGDEHKMRQAVWEVGLVGGTAAYYSRDWVESVVTQPYPDTFAAAPYLGYAASFFRQNIVDLGTLDPHDELVLSGSNVVLSANLGVEYVAYLNTGGTVQIDLSDVNGSASVEWYNPRTGEFSGQTTTTGGGILSFSAPDTNDWVLKIDQGTPDTIPPTTPSNLDATPVSNAQINLIWTAASDSESGISSYKIYRDSSFLNTSTGPSFSDTDLSEDTTYSYEVSAVNGSGLEGSKSLAASATTFADMTAPTIVSAATGGGDPTTVSVTFSEPVESASAATISNYSIDNGVAISNAVLETDLKTVTLTTSSHTEEIIYTLTVNNVIDRASTPNPIAANSTVTYQFIAMEAFDADVQGWVYVASAFRGTTEIYNTGLWDATGGNGGGALRVDLGKDVNGTSADSGGWSKNFVISENNLEVTFDYRLVMNGSIDSKEYAEVLVSVNGVLAGVSPDDYVIHLDGNSVPQDTAWTTVTITAADIGSGTHAVTIGGYLSPKTAGDENVDVYIDNIAVKGASGSVDIVAPSAPTGLLVVVE